QEDGDGCIRERPRRCRRRNRGIFCLPRRRAKPLRPAQMREESWRKLAEAAKSPFFSNYRRAITPTLYGISPRQLETNINSEERERHRHGAQAASPATELFCWRRRRSRLGGVGLVCVWLSSFKALALFLGAFLQFFLQFLLLFFE